MAVKLTTHALDTMRGRGAAGMVVQVACLSPSPARLADVVLDDGGRAVLAEGLTPGVYELTFQAGAYQRGLGLDDAAFLDEVPVRFGIDGALAHVHVPILINPYGYSIYRGG